MSKNQEKREKTVHREQKHVKKTHAKKRHEKRCRAQVQPGATQIPCKSLARLDKGGLGWLGWLGWLG